MSSTRRQFLEAATCAGVGLIAPGLIFPGPVDMDAGQIGMKEAVTAGSKKQKP